MYPAVGREEERAGEDMAQRKQKFEPTKALLWEGESDAGEKKQDRNKRLVVEDHLRDVKQREGKQLVVGHAFNASPRRLGQVDSREFEASLVYRVSCRPVRDIQQYRISNKQNKAQWREGRQVRETHRNNGQF